MVNLINRTKCFDKYGFYAYVKVVANINKHKGTKKMLQFILLIAVFVVLKNSLTGMYS